MDKKNIGRNIRRLRKKCGMTQVELAKAANVTVDHIAHVEIGAGSISVPLLLEICRLLNVTPNDILEGEFSSDSLENDDISDEIPWNKRYFDNVHSDDALILNEIHYFLLRQSQIRKADSFKIS